jgi:transposase InsO family protein
VEKAESRWRTVAAPCACRQVASMRGSSGRSRRATRDRQLRVATRGSHEASHRCYEHPRVWKDFREAGEHVSEQRVARLMRAEGLRAFHTPRVGDGMKRRGPDAGLLHHSDQGCTYASDDYRTRLEQAGITCSMSRRRNCFDNAVMESWFATVKSEAGERFESHAHAKEALFDYIEVFYNQRRRPLHARTDQPYGVRAMSRSGGVVTRSTERDQCHGLTSNEVSAGD